MTETETVISDEQLLDLWLTAWVAGAVDLTTEQADPETRSHVFGCAECLAMSVEYHKARLVAAWEDPAVRASVLDVARATLAHEDRAPKFVTVHTPGRS